MKKLFISIFTLFSFVAQAQQNSLLQQAFWKNRPDVNTVKAEVEKGNSPSEFNSGSFDPVVLAINAEAPTETIKYLVEQQGNDVNKITHDGRVYLHWAASRGNTELIEYLFKKGSKFTAEDSRGTTPLFFAANAGQQNTKVYDLFVAHGLDLKKHLNVDGANALLVGIANDKNFALTDYFISKGLDLNSSDAAGNNAFSYAARSGNIELLKMLIQKGVKPNATAMLMAAQGGRGGANSLEVFQYLESLNLKPNAVAKNGENVLHAIVRKPKQEEIIRYFLSKGVDVNQADEQGNTVFMNAALANRDTAVLSILLPKVKNINQPNEKGITALAMAVRSNSSDVVSYLVGKGADTKVLDKNGNNLAYYLIESSLQPSAGGPGGRAPAGAAERPALAKADEFGAKLAILQKNGLDVKSQQKDGNTLYHLAVAKNDISLLKRLEPLGIDINSKNAEGITPLHKAALISKDDIMLKYLLSIGAKKDIATNFEETAFDLASENESLSKNNVSLTFLK